MNFWQMEHSCVRTALVEESSGRQWSYGDLRREAELFATKLRAQGRRQLGFLLCSNTMECVAAYLGALQAGHPLALFASDLSPELLANLKAIYQPDWIFAPNGEGCHAAYIAEEAGQGHTWWKAAVPQERSFAEPLGLLLSTSGSTGAPKLVRLSYGNLQANAASIREYLHLTVRERPVTSLPMQYSYGLSVLNSHLLAGATILLTNRSVLQREFWEFVHAQRATSFAGVPYTYQMLLRAKLLEHELPFTSLTQAGGRLDPKYTEQVRTIAAAHGWRFFVMYGQTEATARISYVPPDQLTRKNGSIGIAIPGGKLSLDGDSGEIIYSGPNVMMGYAENVADLSKGDELQEILRTGDLGRQDEEGFFYVTGRMKRFLKIFGQRLSLDDVERTLHKQFDVPLACFGSDDHLQVVVESEALTGIVQKFLCDLYKLHHTAVKVSFLEKLPLSSNGKIDYSALAALPAESARAAAAAGTR